MGGCDYCEQYCAQLGVLPVEFWMEEHPDPEWDDEPDEDAIAAYQGELADAIEAHCDLVRRRLACATLDGDWYDVSHAGPRHKPDGSQNHKCSTCADDSAWSDGSWDTDMDMEHSRCAVCWMEVAGGALLDGWRRGSGTTSAPEAVAPTRRGPDWRWRTVADRATVEAALRAYTGTGLPPVRWVPSPAEVADVLSASIDDSGLDPDEEVANGIPGWSIRSAEALATHPTAAYAGDDESTGRARSERERLRSVAVGWLADATAAWPDCGAGTDLVTQLLEDAGQFADRSLPVAAADDDDRAAKRALLDVLAAHAGAIAILPDEIVISERLRVCKLDDDEFHSEAGPALAYKGGPEVHAWHGTRIPAWVIDAPDLLNPTDIDAQQDPSLRRALIERFGPERLVREGSPTLVDEDATGRLWHRALPVIVKPGPRIQTGWMRFEQGEPVTIAEDPVACLETAGHGPDGVHRTRYEMVPAQLRTVAEARAWAGLGEA